MTNLQKLGIAGVVVGLLLTVAYFATTGGQGGTYEITEQYFSGGIDITGSGDIEVDNTVVIDASGNVDAPLTPSSYTEPYEAITTDDTVAATQTGTTFYVSGAEATSTLPAVTSSAGAVIRYVVAGSLTGDFHIDSAEGDNIEGSAIVAGAVVDCDAEDQLNFVSDGENLGDYVELRSNGTKWFLTSSNVLTSAKLTCTDPT